MTTKSEGSSDDKKQNDHQQKTEQTADSQTKSWKTRSVAVFDSVDSIRNKPGNSRSRK